MQQQSNGLSRRETIKWAGLAGLSLLWGKSSAGAQELTRATTLPAKAPMPQGAGYYRMSLGDMNLTVVSDGQLPLPSLFPIIGANVGEEAVKQAAEEAFVSPGPVWFQVNALVIQSGKNTVLVDTGCGSIVGPTLGKLAGNLANAGIKPEDVTHILITHLHRDHFGGLFDDNGKRQFPNAAIYVHAQELAFWSAAEPDLSKSGIPDAMRVDFITAIHTVIDNLQRTGFHTLTGRETEIIPGVTAFLAPGHTPGHQMVRIVSGDQRMIYLTDLVHYQALLLPHPDWYVGFDTDRDAGASARQKHLESLASNRVMVSGAHLPFPSVGHVRKVADGAYQWVPTQWTW